MGKRRVQAGERALESNPRAAGSESQTHLRPAQPATISAQPPLLASLAGAAGAGSVGRRAAQPLEPASLAGAGAGAAGSGSDGSLGRRAAQPLGPASLAGAGAGAAGSDGSEKPLAGAGAGAPGSDGSEKPLAGAGAGAPGSDGSEKPLAGVDAGAPGSDGSEKRAAQLLGPAAAAAGALGAAAGRRPKPPLLLTEAAGLEAVALPGRSPAGSKASIAAAGCCKYGGNGTPLRAPSTRAVAHTGTRAGTSSRGASEGAPPSRCCCCCRLAADDRRGRSPSSCDLYSQPVASWALSGIGARARCDCPPTLQAGGWGQGSGE